MADSEPTREVDARCHCQDNQRHFLERVFSRLRLGEAQRELLVHSFREISVQIPLEVRRHGRRRLEMLSGFRVQGEALAEFGPAYEDYARRTSRWIPRLGVPARARTSAL